MIISAHIFVGVVLEALVETNVPVLIVKNKMAAWLHRKRSWGLLNVTVVVC